MICEICGEEFNGIKRRFQPKYCSDKCRYKGQLKKQLEWKYKERAKKRMSWLVDNQQFNNENNNPLDNKCWVCGSNQALLNHHVKYRPKVIEKTLCRSCHEWLHKVLLKRRKCSPEYR